MQAAIEEDICADKITSLLTSSCGATKLFDSFIDLKSAFPLAAKMETNVTGCSSDETNFHTIKVAVRRMAWHQEHRRHCQLLDGGLSPFAIR